MTADSPSDPGEIGAEESDDAGADVSHGQIAERAYARFLARGGGDGADIDDWLAAEAELRGSAVTSNRPVDEESADQSELPARGKAPPSRW